MGTGYIRVHVTADDEALPIIGAEVIIRQRNGVSLFKTFTNESGKTEDFALPVACFGRTKSVYENPIYTVCDADVRADGFVTKHIRGIEMLESETTILSVHMDPLIDEPNPTKDDVLEIPPNALTFPSYFIKASSPARAQKAVLIPDYITVHLGRPENTSAMNVRVQFAEYIKNVRYTKHQTC
ncbi:MAG: carboxypeptidase-like regulatory domain-containing protein [Oscillospiraceae bacterium]|nr:carboxypeptidase-like regulatory domain-containing protein [Oscillospiraceae bacterium]